MLSAAPFRGIRRQARSVAFAALVAWATLLPPAGATPADARELTLDLTTAPAAASGWTSPRAEHSSRGGRPAPDISTPRGFIAAVAESARESELSDGVPAAVTIAQAILESDWGRSGLSTKAQNYFGIKASSGPGPAGTIKMDTWEVFNGRNTVVKDGFKAYHTLEESVADHGRFLKENPRYSRAFQTTDPKEFGHRIHESGYATDPKYCDKLASLIDKYQLGQYGLQPVRK